LQPTRKDKKLCTRSLLTQISTIFFGKPAFA
jgi:hypothetical protein